MPAAEAPAKYVIDVQRKFSLHICQIGRLYRSATLTATKPELHRYWTKAIRQMAAIYCDVFPTRKRGGPKKKRTVQTVTKVETANTAMLNNSVVRVFDRRQDAGTASTA